MVSIGSFFALYACMCAVNFLIFLMIGSFDWRTGKFAKFIPYGTFMVFSLFWFFYLVAIVMAIILAVLLYIANLIDSAERK